MNNVLILWIFVVVWFGCGVVSYGYAFGYNQNRYKHIADECYWSDMRLALFGIPLGCIALFATLLVYGTKYGLKFK